MGCPLWKHHETPIYPQVSPGLLWPWPSKAPFANRLHHRPAGRCPVGEENFLRNATNAFQQRSGRSWGGFEQPKKNGITWIQLTNNGEHNQQYGSILVWNYLILNLEQTRIDKYLITIFSFVILFKFVFSPLSLQELSIGIDGDQNWGYYLFSDKPGMGMYQKWWAPWDTQTMICNVCGIWKNEMKWNMFPPTPGFVHTKKQHIQTIWYTYHQRMKENTDYTH